MQLCPVHLLLKCYIFDIVVKLVKASVRFLITKSGQENFTHEKLLTSCPFSLHPLLFSRLSTVPDGTLPPPSLTPNRLHSPPFPWRKTSPLISVLCGPPGAPVAVGGLPLNDPSSSGVKRPPSWLSSHHPPPLQTDLGGATAMVPQ